MFFFPSISDAYNDARDKVKYLQTLRQVFEQLQANQTPVTIVSNILPSLAAAVKQMIGQSRVYAKSGFLGFLFMKVCVCVCVRVCVRAYICMCMQLLCNCVCRCVCVCMLKVLFIFHLGIESIVSYML